MTRAGRPASAGDHAVENAPEGHVRVGRRSSPAGEQATKGSAEDRACAAGCPALVGELAIEDVPQDHVGAGGGGRPDLAGECAAEGAVGIVPARGSVRLLPPNAPSKAEDRARARGCSAPAAELAIEDEPEDRARAGVRPEDARGRA